MNKWENETQVAWPAFYWFKHFSGDFTSNNLPVLVPFWRAVSLAKTEIQLVMLQNPVVGIQQKQQLSDSEDAPVLPLQACGTARPPCDSL